MKKLLRKLLTGLLTVTVISSAVGTGAAFSAAAAENTAKVGVIPSVEYADTIYSLDDYITALRKTARSTDELKQALAAAENYVPYVDNSQLKYFPEIRNQSGPTCVVWGAVYYQFTHQINKALDRAASDAATFNPTFIYNLYTGARVSHLEEILNATGCAPLSLIPDYQDLKTWHTGYDIWREAANYRISSYMHYDSIGRKNSLITSADDAKLDAIKATLRNGDVISCSAYCDADGRPWFQTEKIPAAPGVAQELVGQKIATKVCMQTKNMAHMLTIVGYNDNIWTDINKNGKVDNGEMGALKIANSWGKTWMDNGFLWIAYDALNEQSVVEGMSYDSDRLPAFDNQLYKVNISKVYGTSGIFLKHTLNSDNRTDSYVEIIATRKTDGMTYTRKISPYNNVSYANSSYQKVNYEGKTGFCDGAMVTDLNTVIEGLDSNTFHDYEWRFRFVDTGTDTAATTVKEAYVVDENTSKTYPLNTSFPFSLNSMDKSASLKDYYHFSKLYVPAASTLTVGSELKFTFKTANETFGSSPIKYTMTVTRGDKTVFSKQHKASSVDKINHSSVIKGTWKPTAAGTYTITIAGTDASGTSISRSATFTVYKPQLAVRSISIDKGKYVGQYESVKITPQVTGGTAPYTYSYYYIKGGKTVKIAENTKSAAKTKTFNAKTGKYTLLVKVKDAKGTTAQTTQTMLVSPIEIEKLSFRNDNLQAGMSITLNPIIKNLPSTLTDLQYAYTVTHNGTTTALTAQSNHTASWRPSENGSYTLSLTLKKGSQIYAQHEEKITVGNNDTLRKITVNVINYVCNETNAGSYYIHYWGGKDGIKDVACKSLNTSKKANVGYWSTAQLFQQYVVYIPTDATGYKFHIGDRWFGADGNPKTSNTVYAFNYSTDKAVYTME